LAVALGLTMAALPLCADGLTFTLTPGVSSGTPRTFPVSVGFEGSLLDSGSANTCDTLNTDCLDLNFVNITFDLDQAISDLTADPNPFYNNAAGTFSDDGLFNSYSGIVFGIYISPNTPLGVYTGTATILGGYDNPNASTVLASQTWELIVAPEPAAFGLALAGLAGVLLARRRIRRVAP
jgi:hypothetical protein